MNVTSINQPSGKPLPNGDTKMIPIELLFVDQSYGHQRPLSEQWILERLNQFKPAKLRVIDVSARSDGTFAVLDGQHRVDLARRNGINHIECKVRYNLTPEQEADLFLGLNDARPPTAVDKFAGGVAAGDKKVIKIASAMRKAGYRIAPGKSQDEAVNVGNATTYCQIYDDFGESLLVRSLVIYKNTWNGRKPPGTEIAALVLLLKAGCDEAHLRKTLIRDAGETCHPGAMKQRVKRHNGGVLPKTNEMPIRLAIEWLAEYASLRGDRKKKSVTKAEVIALKNGGWLRYGGV